MRAIKNNTTKKNYAKVTMNKSHLERWTARIS